LSAPELIEVAVGAPYVVAFSTRLGGVSEGPYRSLNLGLLTDDVPERVHENRRRLCTAVGADPAQATMAWQQHGARVVEATPTGIVGSAEPLEPCDGLWSEEPGQAMMLVTADCLPVALYRTDGEPALCLLHVGWRGLLAGIVAQGALALGGGSLAAAIGPGIGPCCYRVGREVAGRFVDVFGASILDGDRLDLVGATEQALLRAGSGRVERLEACTACDAERFFSHRRDQGRTGRQGVIGYVA
jgi:YfiH family protein